MIESFGDIDFEETNKKEVFDFSIENFILKNKQEKNISNEILKESSKIFDISFNSDLEENDDNKHFFEKINYEDYKIDENINTIFNESQIYNNKNLL